MHLMKYPFTVLRSLVCLGLFGFMLSAPVALVSADDGNDSEEQILTCPRETTIPRFYVDPRYDKACNAAKVAEVVAAGAFTDEINMFENQVLKPLYQDNQSPVDFIARKGIWELRQHEVCLQRICEEVFQQCGKDLTSAQGIGQIATWCNPKVDQVMELQSKKLELYSQQNAERKSRSLLIESFRGVAGRWHQYIRTPLLKALENFAKFSSGVHGLIGNPAG